MNKNKITRLFSKEQSLAKVIYYINCPLRVLYSNIDRYIVIL